MRNGFRLLQTLIGLLILALAGVSATLARDVPFVPTPQPVVEEMLRLAEIDAKDMLYDLGSGDGRIVITAAKQHGARGVGVDIDPERIAESRENAKAAGVEHKVRFIQGDLFKVDLRAATAVTLYLLPAVNERLRPKLLKELRPGTPVVSHSFDMGDWEPEQTVNVGRSTVYLWHIPARVAGQWEFRATGADGRAEQHRLNIAQEVDRLRGTVTVDGETYTIEDGRVRARRLMYTIKRPRASGAMIVQRYEGMVEHGRIARMTLREDTKIAQRDAPALR